MRFVKYYAGNVAAVGAAGRGIGTDLAVWTGVAPAFPPASRLSTPSPTLALPSRRPSGLFIRPLQFTLTRPSGDLCRASLARRWIALQSIRRKPCGRQPPKPAQICLKFKNQNHTRLALACHPQNSSPPDLCGNATPLTPLRRPQGRGRIGRKAHRVLRQQRARHARTHRRHAPGERQDTGVFLIRHGVWRPGQHAGSGRSPRRTCVRSRTRLSSTWE